MAASTGDRGDSPDAGLTNGIEDLFAAHEVALIRARTKAALAIKKSRGERTGDIPYGKRLAPDGKHLEPNPDEQAVIARMGALRADGLSFGGVAKALESEGFAPRGKAWHAMTVSRALGGAL